MQHAMTPESNVQHYVLGFMQEELSAIIHWQEPATLVHTAVSMEPPLVAGFHS